AQAIDKEVSQMLGDAFQTAQSIINKKRTILNTIADTLLEKETLEKEEFDSIVSEKTISTDEKTV
ncbi:MAG: hypothetical protein EOM19_07320, partial [Candidatus Moranbacteria bacterium]|nr:hypothetical protein [Candidatus Moranbacteria bacterium]